MKSRLILIFCLSLLSAPLSAQIQAVLTLQQGDTPLGQLVLILDHVRAPRVTANFIGLATGEFAWVDPATGTLQQGRPFYDGVIFHRLIHDFMIQGGDPTGTGMQGPGYHFQDQFHPELRHFQYVVSMANSGPNTNGSQFFITFGESHGLNDKHAVFGWVSDADSQALLQDLKSPDKHPTNAQDRPLTDIVIESVTIENWDPETFDIHDPALEVPTVRPENATLAFEVDGDGVRQPYLEWKAKDLHAYPFSETNDLRNWHGTARHIYMMGGNPTYRTPITPAQAEEPRFARTFSVDYTNLPQAPLNVFLPGSTLRLHLQDGRDFNFVFTAPDANGHIGSFWITGDAPNPIVLANNGESHPNLIQPLDVYPKAEPEEATSDRIFRLLRLRSMFVIYEDHSDPAEPVLRYIAGTLSFHSETQGWYTTSNGQGWVPFTWTPPEN